MKRGLLVFQKPALTALIGALSANTATLL